MRSTVVIEGNWYSNGALPKYVIVTEKFYQIIVRTPRIIPVLKFTSNVSENLSSKAEMKNIIKRNLKTSDTGK